MTQAWIYLAVAGICEIGWPLGFKLAQIFPACRLPCIILSVASMTVSGFLLYLAQKSIPIGTAYAVWTGIGAAGTFIVGIALFGDVLNAGRVMGVSMIVGGVVLLKILGSAAAS